MSGRKLRWLGLSLVTTGGAGVLALASMINSAFAFGEVAPPLPPPEPDIVQVMGGSGLPIPNINCPGPDCYVTAVNNLYIHPNFPTSPAINALFTPEGLYPITGVKSLPLDQSVSQGVTILNDTIAPTGTVTEPTGVFGYSQSAIISSLEMEKLDPSGTPSDMPLRFVLIGNEMNPNGGILERFAGLTLPSLGINFYGATPADDFPTTMYSLEYDGFADFPRYPLNLLSDLNAVAGIQYVHGTYPDLTLQQVTPVAEGGQAILLPTDGGLTTYYMIPVNNLPLLDPLRDVPVIGNPLADLVQPDLQYIVNLGYGDPDFGWSTSPANVPTQFGLLPGLDAFEKLPGLLLSGAQTGIANFIGDFTGGGPNPVSLSLDSLPSLFEGSSGSSILTDPLALLSSPTDLVNNLSAAASDAYSALLPTADIANALLTSLPAYDASLFVDNLNDPINAIGLPIAADMGLTSLAGGIEVEVLLNTATAVASDLGLGALTSLIPF